MVKGVRRCTMVEGMGEPYKVPMNLSRHNAKAQRAGAVVAFGGFDPHRLRDGNPDRRSGARRRAWIRWPTASKLIPAEHKRHHAALDLAVGKSGYGVKPLPAGHAYGVALHESFGTVVAYVVTASVENGAPKLHKVTAAVHCNQAVNPMSIEAQVQGAVLMAVGTTLPGAAITLKDGKVEQSQLSDYTVARMPDMPQVEVHIVASTDRRPAWASRASRRWRRPMPTPCSR
jgi:isoquinoline 1-oxidoreductase beta subunit